MSIKDLIAEMASISYEINKNSEHTVFFDFSGHVNWLTCYIFVDGYYGGKGRVDILHGITKGSISLEDDTEERTIEILTKAKNELLKWL